jgi:hypothetical protein
MFWGWIFFYFFNNSIFLKKISKESVPTPTDSILKSQVLSDTPVK